MSGDMDFLLPEPAPPADTYRWATVTQVDPPRIRLDGETVPIASEPVTLCPLRLGCRVWVQFHGRMMIILGVAQDGPVQLGQSVDLNTLVDPGDYHQRNNSWGTTALNYPASLAGFLEVDNATFTDGLAGVSTDYIYQRYRAYNNTQSWERTYYRSAGTNTGWSTWRALS